MDEKGIMIFLRHYAANNEMKMPTKVVHKWQFYKERGVEKEIK